MTYKMFLLEAHIQPGLGKRRASSGYSVDNLNCQLLIEIFLSQNAVKNSRSIVLQETFLCKLYYH